MRIDVKDRLAMEDPTTSAFRDLCHALGRFGANSRLGPARERDAFQLLENSAIELSNSVEAPTVAIPWLIEASSIRLLEHLFEGPRRDDFRNSMRAYLERDHEAPLKDLSFAPARAGSVDLLLYLERLGYPVTEHGSTLVHALRAWGCYRLERFLIERRLLDVDADIFGPNGILHEIKPPARPFYAARIERMVKTGVTTPLIRQACWYARHGFWEGVAFLAWFGVDVSRIPTGPKPSPDAQELIAGLYSAHRRLTFRASEPDPWAIMDNQGRWKNFGRGWSSRSQTA